MRAERFGVLTLTIMLLFVCCGAGADVLPSLPMDTYEGGPAPKDAAFLSDTEYADESITVKIYQDRYAKTDYLYAHIKISHPSQLRTAPASLVQSRMSTFKAMGDSRGRLIAKEVNAVIAINGDYYSKTDKCKVVLRQCQQVRNTAEGTADLLIIDTNGDFSILPNCTKPEYAQYYKEHEGEMYNVFCFGPVLVQDGKSVIGDDYYNGFLGSSKGTQRSAIAQLGPLEYMIVSCSSEQASDGKDKGMTLQEFAHVCEEAGKRLSENGCILAYNLDGGNSATMNFKVRDRSGELKYVKINPGQERFLSDIIYFATLVK